MKHLLVALLAAMGVCTAHAADPVPRSVEPGVISVLQGQMKFLDASVTFCQEQMPALKRDLSAARAHAEAEMRKAETIIRDELAGDIKTFQRYLDAYADGWSKYADQQMVALKRQAATNACPTLVSSWTNFEADVVVEDWHNFLERSPQSGEATPQGVAGAR